MIPLPARPVAPHPGKIPFPAYRRHRPAIHSPKSPTMRKRTGIVSDRNGQTLPASRAAGCNRPFQGKKDTMYHDNNRLPKEPRNKSPGFSIPDNTGTSGLNGSLRTPVTPDISPYGQPEKTLRQTDRHPQYRNLPARDKPSKKRGKTARICERTEKKMRNDRQHRKKPFCRIASGSGTHRLARTGTGKPDQLRFALASTS